MRHTGGGGRAPTFDFIDYDGGVAITHTTSAGFRGAGRILDPMFRLYFSEQFARALDEHVKTEFLLLRDRFAARQRRAFRESGLDGGLARRSGEHVLIAANHALKQRA